VLIKSERKSRGAEITTPAFQRQRGNGSLSGKKPTEEKRGKRITRVRRRGSGKQGGGEGYNLQVPNGI